MDRPLHLDMRAASVSSSRMMFAVSLAVLLEAGAIYLVGSGLGARVMKALPQTLNINVVEPATKQVQSLPPSHTQFERPSLPMVSRPVIKIETPAAANPLAGQSTQPAGTQSKVTTATQSPAKSFLPAPTPPSAITATHSLPPYPMLARRIGEQGTVFLSIIVGADGNVQDAAVAKSSGKADLDEAAMAWVKTHWKYRPASRNGQPVGALVEAQMVFDLNQAR